MTQATDAATKVQVVKLMAEGYEWDEAVQRAGAKVSRPTVYRWRQRMREEGKEGLEDRRCGHAWKLRQEEMEWLEETCRERPEVAGSELQSEIRERFEVEVSVTHINRVRAKLGVRRPKKGRK